MQVQVCAFAGYVRRTLANQLCGAFDGGVFFALSIAVPRVRAFIRSIRAMCNGSGAAGVALILCCVVGATAHAGGSLDKPGLMWNRTGLPLSFPLRVKSVQGQDYVVLLRDAETGRAALAANVLGGTFFSVLVPPGTFDVFLIAHAEWQGDKTEPPVDGPGTLRVVEPLTFAVLGHARKSGFTIDITAVPLSGPSGVQVVSQDICQRRVAGRSARQVIPKVPPLENPVVGEEIQRNRFLRGDNAIDTADRLRMQRQGDPVLLGAPAVPLAMPEPRPEPRTPTGTGTAQRGSTLIEQQC